MITKNIELKTLSENSIDYNNTSEIDKIYFLFKNNDENELNIYANTIYNISFPLTNQTEKYYFIIKSNHTSYIRSLNVNDTIYTYYYGGIDELELKTDSNSRILISNSFIFKPFNIGQNLSWCVYKLTESNTNFVVNTYITGGRIILHNPLIFVKLNYRKNNLLIHDSQDPNYEETKDYIYIEKQNIRFSSNKSSIILYKNYNYIFEVEDLDNTNEIKNFNIYNTEIVDYDKISMNNAGVNLTEFNEHYFNDINTSYKWSVNDNIINHNSGVLIIKDLSKNMGNDEILKDHKYKNIYINYKLIYKKFIFNEYKNIHFLNNDINNLLIEHSGKQCIINNTLKNITIVLPSFNIYLGLSYDILINSDLSSLSILCEDNALTLDYYDSIKGSLFINNLDNLYCKTNSSRLETLDDNLETDLSQKIFVKSTILKNGTTYNGGLYKFGKLKLTSIEYVV